ncbi:hypothetical protein KGZ01_18140 [Pseudomonas aeruginosa]|uniref:hypothetical protein n=1 Tax=Pseudomonas aeruginosa TaxID=287 RepID=UPI002341C7C7|nr:hypothetical protein [Pseudomonas aeruginosa]MDC3993151.1 hypothetical protein [Pseudomonas aeruginosa]
MSLGTFLFNACPVDVGVCPGIQLLTIKADALHSNAEFTHVGPDGFVEFGATHAEVGGGRTGSQDSGWAGDQACGYLFR